MAKIYDSLTQLIGKTPLLELSNYNTYHNLNARVIAKLEYRNPAGSVKDRIAFSAIRMLRRGECSRRARLFEPTSGNTGIGLASAQQQGMRIILTMPETMSIERETFLQLTEQNSS